MAQPHLQSGEVGDVRPLGVDLVRSKTAVLVKTDRVELIRLVLPKGKSLKEHKAPGEIIVQCLEGRVTFTASNSPRELASGQLLYLTAGEPHAVEALEDSSLLVTILLKAD